MHLLNFEHFYFDFEFKSAFEILSWSVFDHKENTMFYAKIIPNCRPTFYVILSLNHQKLYNRRKYLGHPDGSKLKKVSEFFQWTFCLWIFNDNHIHRCKEEKIMFLYRFS